METPLATPFNMIVLGMTGCGKTYHLLKKNIKTILITFP